MEKRVVIAGPGVLGAATAYHLARAGVPVTLVCGGSCAAERVNAGFSGLGRPVSPAADHLRLVRSALKEHLAVSRGSTADGWCRSGAALVWQLDGKIAERVDPLRRQGEVLWQLTRDEALALAGPDLWIPPKVTEVAYAPREAMFDTEVCIRSLVRLAAESGAKVIPGDCVVAFDADGPGWMALLASGGRLAAKAVVNAMGADAGRLAPRRIPSVITRALLVAVHTPGITLTRTVHTDRVSMRPAGPGEVLARSDVADWLLDEGFPVAEAEAELLRRVREVLPRVAADATTEVRMGSRTVVLGDLPITGADPELPGYFEPVAPCSVLMGPLLGRLLAEQIVRGVQPAELTRTEW
jgi:glycine/D-amino acid oxidase-like deaminating enzyme